MKHVTAASGVPSFDAKSWEEMRRCEGFGIPASRGPAGQDNDRAAPIPQSAHRRFGRSAPGDTARKGLRNHKVVHQREEFLEARRIGALQVRDDRNAGVAGNPGRADRARHPMVINKKRARISNQRLRRRAFMRPREADDLEKMFREPVSIARMIVELTTPFSAAREA
jgi:hypothetical protein